MGLSLVSIAALTFPPITNTNIRQAVTEWLNDATAAELTYGHISDWDVSSVTNMNCEFAGSMCRGVHTVSHVFVGLEHACWLYGVNIELILLTLCVCVEAHIFTFSSSFNQPLNDWDMSSVTSKSCKSVASIGMMF